MDKLLDFDNDIEIRTSLLTETDNSKMLTVVFQASDKKKPTKIDLKLNEAKELKRLLESYEELKE
jgi:hypothetical protein